MQCGNTNVFSIFLGDAKTLNLKALYADTLDPLDLTACTEIDIALPKSDGSFLHLLLSLAQVTILSPAVLGKYQAPITSLNSANLLVGELQNIDVTFTISGEVFTVRYGAALTVLQP